MTNSIERQIALQGRLVDLGLRAGQISHERSKKNKNKIEESGYAIANAHKWTGVATGVFGALAGGSQFAGNQGLFSLFDAGKTATGSVGQSRVVTHESQKSLAEQEVDKGRKTDEAFKNLTETIKNTTQGIINNFGSSRLTVL